MFRLWIKRSLYTLRRGIGKGRYDGELVLRFQSTASKSQRGRPLKAVLITIGGTVGLLGGVTTYAIVDPSFRQTVEDLVPYSKTVFDYVLVGRPEKVVESETGKDDAKKKTGVEKGGRISDSLAEKAASVTGSLEHAKDTVTETAGTIKDKTVEQVGRIWDAVSETAVVLTGKGPKTKDTVQEKSLGHEIVTGAAGLVTGTEDGPGERKEAPPAEQGAKRTVASVEEEAATTVISKKADVTEPVEGESQQLTHTDNVPVGLPASVLEPAAGTSTVVPSSAEDVQSAAAKTASTSDEPALVQEKTVQEETIFAVESKILENRLMDLETKAHSAVDVATEAYQRAKNATKGHMAEVMQAVEKDLEGNNEALWTKAIAAAHSKMDAVKAAEERAEVAVKAVEKLKEAISDGRKNKLTQTNQKLISFEEAVGKFLYRIDNAKTMLIRAQREDKAIEDYRDLVEQKQKEFKQEMAELLPEVKVGEMDSKLTREELNMFISHAYKKVLQLQMHLAKQQTVDQHKYITTLEQQRADDESVTKAKIIAELANQQRELETEYNKKASELKEELEQELRQQLRRQANVHSDHLADVLNVQEKELERKWLSVMNEVCTEEHTKYKTCLAGMIARLKGLEAALGARADIDKSARKAQELWLACQTLKTTIKTGKVDATSWEEQLKPLQTEISAVAEATGANNPYVEAVMSAIPEEACVRGVYTEDAMKERFIKVERVCRQVAMIDENGGTLLKYLLSYLQSFLVVSAFQSIPGAELRDEAVDVENFTTFDVLSRARYCIDKDDMQQALRYMNLLRGAPRYVAQDWLRETRLLLETRQAADALIAHAAATGMQAL